MNVLTVFEQRISAIFEEGAPGVRKPISFKRLAKRAVREMEDETFVIDGIDTAPALYTVLVSTVDDQNMRPLYLRICEEVSQLIEAQAKKRGYTFVGKPLVRFMVDPALRHGKFSVFAENIDPRTLARLRDEENAYLGIAPAPAEAPVPPAETPAPPAQAPAATEPEVPSASEVLDDLDLSMEEPEGMEPVAAEDPVAAEGGDAAAEPNPEDLLEAEVDAILMELAEPAPTQAEKGAAEQLPEVEAPVAVEPADADEPQAEKPGTEEARLEAPEAEEAPEAMPSWAPEAEIPAFLAEAAAESQQAKPAPHAPRHAAPASAHVPEPAPEPAQEPAPEQVAAAPSCTLTDLHSGKVHHIDQQQVAIGRERVAGGLVLTDPNVSRHHAELTFDGAAWHIRDLNSTNGTLVNNVDVPSATLHDGDVLIIGLTELEFRAG